MVNEIKDKLIYKISKWTLIILIILAIIIIFSYIIDKRNNTNKDYIIQTDTIYNKVRLDSIEYNIIKIDSTIVKLKIKYDEAVEKSNNLGDSATVELFKELVDSPD